MSGSTGAAFFGPEEEIIRGMIPLGGNARLSKAQLYAVINLVDKLFICQKTDMWIFLRTITAC